MDEMWGERADRQATGCQLTVSNGNRSHMAGPDEEPESRNSAGRLRCDGHEGISRNVSPKRLETQGEAGSGARVYELRPTALKNAIYVSVY